MSPTVSIHVTITVAPENEALFLSHLKPVYEIVVAEPECLFFEVFRNPEVRGQFRFVEDWNASVEWLKEVQLKKEYYKPYVAATEPLWTKPRTIEVWERMPGTEWVTVKKELSEKV